MNNYDAVVVGAGSGGLTSAVGLKKLGKSVLLIESQHLGGECTNSGCIPSKALLHHAKEYHTATKLAGTTYQSDTYRREAFKYVRNIINNILAEETAEHFSELGIDVVIGEAIFTSKNSITVAGIEYKFKKAIIATGSAPREISIPGLNDADLLTNQNFFEQTSVPPNLLIVGGGPIGMEMGQAMAMLGSKVTIIDNGPVFARLEDEAIRPIIQKAFTGLGINILTEASVKSISGKVADIEAVSADRFALRREQIHFDKVLIAIGRVPNLPKGLHTAEIKSEPYGIVVNKKWQTSNKNVYALGDVSARLKFTHVADDTARQVVAHIASFGLLSVKERAVPKVTYTEPEIGQVGLSWHEAKEECGEERVIRIEVPFSASDRARTDDDTSGLLVIIAKRLTGKILGAHIIGPRAGELISTLTLSIENNISLYRLRSTIFAYPTYSLILKKAGDYFLAKQLTNLKSDLLYFFKKNAPKIIILGLWLWGLLSLYSYQQTFGLTASELSIKLFKTITATAWAPALYILAYTLRPITFIPGTALTILSGVFFGLWGILYTIIGANLSSVLAYSIGRFFSKDSQNKKSILGNWTNRLNQNPFLTIITMRLIFMPFDVVNYGAGLLRVRFLPYLTATFVGTLLGIATFVAIGASLSVEEFIKNGITTEAIDSKFLLLSLAIFITSIIISKFLKKN
ncbi:MAG: FAD-dependent oxidoreductase [Candidatus Paceibacterota bacterium]